MAYSTVSDLYDFGVPRGATPNPGRNLDSLVSSVATLDVHGFTTGDPISFRAIGTMPSGLVAGTTYYAEAVTESTFKVRATPTGSALSIGVAADPIVVIAPLNTDAAITWADAMVDDMLTDQTVPLSPVPQIIRITSAELAAFRLVGSRSAQSRSLTDIMDRAQKRLDRWLAGRPVTGTADDTRDNLAVADTTPTTGASDGWARWGGL